MIWVGAYTLCLFFGRASGFATAGVEVGGFRVGTTDEEERLGSLPTKIWRFERGFTGMAGVLGHGTHVRFRIQHHVGG